LSVSRSVLFAIGYSNHKYMWYNTGYHWSVLVIFPWARFLDASSRSLLDLVAGGNLWHLAGHCYRMAHVHSTGYNQRQESMVSNVWHFGPRQCETVVFRASVAGTVGNWLPGVFTVCTFNPLQLPLAFWNIAFKEVPMFQGLPQGTGTKRVSWRLWVVDMLLWLIIARTVCITWAIAPFRSFRGQGVRR
jgi:hypothetical protein